MYLKSNMISSSIFILSKFLYIVGIFQKIYPFLDLDEDSLVEPILVLI